MNELVWCTGEMMVIGKNWSAWRKFCPSDCGVNANLCQLFSFYFLQVWKNFATSFFTKPMNLIVILVMRH